MPYSAITYDNQDAGKTVYDLTFSGPAPGYLDTTHIYLYRDLVQQVGGFTWNSATNVTLDTPTIQGEHIMFRRITPKADPLVDFELDTVLTDTDLDLSTLQILYISHEMIDGFIQITSAGFLDLDNKKLINVADGTADTDGINYLQLTSSIATALVTTNADKLAAAASAAAAAISETNAATSESNSASSASDSSNSATSSAGSASASAISAAASEASRAAAEVIEGNIAAAGDAELAEIAAAGDSELSQISTEGDSELLQIATEGDSELSQIAAAGDAEIVDIQEEGDTQNAELQAIVAAANVNKTVRQTVLVGPDLEATPSTIETAATKTGNLRNVYHDLDMDMLTGSRGGMTITKRTDVAYRNLIGGSVLGEVADFLYIDGTEVIVTTSINKVRQYLATGVELGSGTDYSVTNLYAFQTTHKIIIDGNEWHYNPISGFAMCKYEGTGANIDLKHPMGSKPLFYSIKRLTGSAEHWRTGRYGTHEVMRLNGDDGEVEQLTFIREEADENYIYIGNDTSVSVAGTDFFVFGWFGNSLDDLETGMVGKRGVTASYIATGTTTVDTGITDIQMIFNKRIDDVSDWRVRNKAAGFDKYTVLNDIDAEVTTGSIVSGSEITLALGTQTHLVVVIGGTADAPDNKLKAGTKVLRKVGTALNSHQIHLGAAYAGGDAGGMVFGRRVGTITSNLVFDTLRGIRQILYTDTDDIDTYDADTVSAFATYGIRVDDDGKINAAEMIQFTGFNTTHKATIDSVDWEYNPLTGFAMCKYTGTGVAREIAHPMGKAPSMLWVKNLTNVFDWATYHITLGATKKMRLNLDSIVSTSGVWGTGHDEEKIRVATQQDVNFVGEEYTMYGWFGDDLSDIETGLTGERGVSAMWQYTGGSGAMSVDTGIENITAVLFKNSDAVGDWYLFNISGAESTFYPLNTSAVEAVSTTITVEGSVVNWVGGADTVEFMVFGSKADSGVDNDVILPASISEPVIASMANGFDSVGNVDIIKKLTASQTLNVTGAAGKKFIYMKQDGLLYFTDQRPEYLRDYYPYAKGNHVYDILGAKMYNASGVAESAVFIGECLLDALGNVYDIFTYAKGNLWESNWFIAEGLSNYLFDLAFGHGIFDATIFTYYKLTNWIGKENATHVEISSIQRGGRQYTYEDYFRWYTSTNASVYMSSGIKQKVVMNRRF